MNASWVGEGKRGDRDWQPMATAPKDGTIIEVKCTYGVAPWFDLFRWTNKYRVSVTECGTDRDGKPYSNQKPPEEITGDFRWHSATKDGSSIDGEDDSFMWRPTSQIPESYIDPTGGAQNTQGYWIRACGLPVPPGADETKLSEMGRKPIEISTPMSVKGFIVFLFTSKWVTQLIAISVGYLIGSAWSVHWHALSLIVIPLALAFIVPMAFKDYRARH